MSENANPSKAILIVSGVILVVSAGSLFSSYTAAQKRSAELSELSTQIKEIGEQMAKLRAQLDAKEAAKTAAPGETADAAETPAPVEAPPK